MWFKKKAKTRYYCVAGHTFRLVSALNQWDKFLRAYQPFEVPTQKEERYLFSVSIEKRVLLPSHQLLWEFKPKEDEYPYYSISRTETGYLLSTAYLLYFPRRFHLLTDRTFQKSTLLVPPEYGTQALPDYETDFGINFLVMQLYALASMPYQTLHVHSSCVMHEGKAYLFFGPSGTGKSTHSQLWIQHISGSELLNDDGPVIRVEANGEVRAYGSPWSGKTPCYKNLSAPLGAIVDLQQAPENSIIQLPPVEAYLSLRSSSAGMKWERQIADHMDRTLVAITEQIPHYRLRCRPDKEAAELCASTVKKNTP